MSKRLEFSIIDGVINKRILGKRTLGLPLKYYYERPREKLTLRFKDALYYP